jgi:hypothetical protein
VGFELFIKQIFFFTKFIASQFPLPMALNSVFSFIKMSDRDLKFVYLFCQTDTFLFIIETPIQMYVNVNILLGHSVRYIFWNRRSYCMDRRFSGSLPYFLFLPESSMYNINFFVIWYSPVLCLVSYVEHIYIWLFLLSTALLLHAHKNTFFYRYNIIEAGKTVADV